MKRFLRAVALRVAVAWLSPSTVVMAIAGVGLWRVDVAIKENAPQVASAARSIAAAAGQLTQPTNARPHGWLAGVQTGVDDLFAESRNITIAMLRPCKAGHPDGCGLIPAARTVAQNTGAAVSEITRQTQQSGALIQTTTESLRTTSEDLHGFIGQGTVDLATLNGAIAQTQPMLAAYTRAGDEINRQVAENGPVFAATLTHLDATMGHVEGITGDIYDFEHPYVHPPPCRTKGCRFKRYFVEPLGTAAGFAGNVYEGSLLFRRLPVTVH